MLGLERQNRRNADFGRLFEEPLEALGILGRGARHGEGVGELLEFVLRRDDAHGAAPGVVVDNLAAVELAPPVGDVEPVAACEAEHPHAVFRLLLAQRVERRSDVGSVEELHVWLFGMVCLPRGGVGPHGCGAGLFPPAGGAVQALRSCIIGINDYLCGGNAPPGAAPLQS